MNWPPQVSDFQAQFTREFAYGQGLDSITANDVQRGLNEADINFNPSLFDQPTDQMTAYLYLAAHIMVINIRDAAGGLSAIPRGKGVRNQGEQVAVSKGIGPANVTYQVPPPRIADSPTLLFLWQTTFGQQYLRMVTPQLIGNMSVVGGPNDVAEIGTWQSQQ